MQVTILENIIIVPFQYVTRCIGQPQERVQRRIQPATIDFGHYFISGATLELEYIEITWPVNATVDDLRQVDLLRVLCGVVGFGFIALGQSIHSIRNGIGKPFSFMVGSLADTVAAGLGIQR